MDSKTLLAVYLVLAGLGALVALPAIVGQINGVVALAAGAMMFMKR